MPNLVQIVRERPAVAASIAGGLLVTLAGLIVLAFVSRKRRREAAALGEDTARRAYGHLTSSFLDHLSHELYTPLTPVKAYASILKRVELPAEEVQQVAERMIAASGQLERVFEVLVALAEMRRSAPDTQQDAIDLAAVIGRAADRVPESRRPSISIAVSPAMPQVRVNERLLELAVWALIDNAIKFSTGRIVVRADIQARGDREVFQIRVTDRGIGMSPEQFRVATDAFRQVDGSLTRPFGGLGVGLALADEVARAHGGRMLAASRLGKGSTVTLSIPLIPAAIGIPVVRQEQQETG